MRVCFSASVMEKALADDGLVLVYGLLLVFWMVIWHVVRMYVKRALTSIA